MFLNLKKIIISNGVYVFNEPQKKTKNTYVYYLAKFTRCFMQVQQVQVLNWNHEYLSLSLIDTYRLTVTRQYIYEVNYYSHCKKK